MKRREFITLLGGAAAAWSLAARAQQPERLALLGSGAAQSSNIFVEALKQGLADNGLIEGKAYVLDVRWAEGEYGRFPALAAGGTNRKCQRHQRCPLLEVSGRNMLAASL